MFTAFINKDCVIWFKVVLTTTHKSLMLVIVNVCGWWWEVVQTHRIFEQVITQYFLSSWSKAKSDKQYCQANIQEVR